MTSRLFPKDVSRIIAEYAISYKKCLIPFVENNRNKINWETIWYNPNAFDYLMELGKPIYWYWVSGNPAAIELLMRNPSEIDYNNLSRNPAAIEYLLRHPRKIIWYTFSTNPAIFHDDIPRYKKELLELIKFI